MESQLLLVSLLQLSNSLALASDKTFSSVIHKPVQLYAVDVPPFSQVTLLEEPRGEAESLFEFQYRLVLSGCATASSRWIELPTELPEY